MAVQIFVGGVEVSDKRLTSSPLSWSDQLNGRGSLSILFGDEVDGWRPEDGQEILIGLDDPAELLTADEAPIHSSDDAAILSGPQRLFGGLLIEPQEWEDVAAERLYFQCSAVEFSALCDRRIVSRIYEQQTVGDIVRDIVARDLEGEGVGISGVWEGPTIEKAVFPDVTVTEAFNDLGELVGYVWRIDEYKILHFRPWAAEVAGLPLDGGTLLKGSVRVKRDRQVYRNVQIVRAGKDLTDDRTETLVGDGARRVFATAFPLGSVPTVEESRGGGAWVAKTVGILGVEEACDWYWNSGQAQISQDDGGTILAAPTTPGNPATGDRVRVTYRGLFPVKTQYQDLEEIAARQAIEGGSGIYTHVESKPTINSAQSALDTAIALVSRYGRIGTVVEGRSRAGIFAPGQVVMVTLPHHGIEDEEMLIESVAAEYNDEAGEVWYSIVAMSGDPFGGWQRYFRRLLTAQRALVVGREGEVLVLIRAAAEPVECNVALDVDTMAPESRIGIMQIGTGEIGAAA